MMCMEREKEEEKHQVGWMGSSYLNEVAVVDRKWVGGWVPYLVGTAFIDQADVLEEEEGIFNRTFFWVTLQALGAGHVCQAVELLERMGGWVGGWLRRGRRFE